MKVLILSCVMGEGHNSAAYAIMEYLKKQNIECEVLDTLSLAGKDASKKAASSYLFTTKIPMLFRLTYYTGRIVSSPKRKSPVYYGNSKYRYQLDRYIRKHGYDTVIATHLFPAEVLTALKREDLLSVTTMSIVTDYTCSPMWEETELDYYVIPHPELIDEFVKRGIPKNKLLPYGIPVKQSFYQKSQKDTARQFVKDKYHLSFDRNIPWYFIMSGSMGYGKIHILVNAIVQAQKAEVNIIIVCGTNLKLRDRLNYMFRNHKTVATLGFVNDISLLMDACDIFFTKPGGLSSTEGAMKNIPIIHTAPIPGNETYNGIFFSNHGMSFYSKNVRKQLQAAKMLCQDTAYNEYMIQSQRETMNYNSCELIYKALSNMQPKEGEITC